MFQRDQCLTCELFFGVDKRAVSKASNLVLTSWPTILQVELEKLMKAGRIRTEEIGQDLLVTKNEVKTLLCTDDSFRSQCHFAWLYVVPFFSEDFLVAQSAVTWIWIMPDWGLSVCCIIGWIDLYTARWTVTNGSTILTASSIHEDSLGIWCYPCCNCKSTFLPLIFKNALMYVFQYTFLCICSFIKIVTFDAVGLGSWQEYC